MKCPCYKCEERNAHCHSTCERYKEYRAELDRRRTTLADAEVRDFILDSIERNRRLKNAKNSH